VSPGTTGLLLRLERGGIVQGALRGIDATTRHCLQVELRSIESDKRIDLTVPAMDGEFEFTSVPQGSWQFECGVRGLRTPLLSVGPLWVRAGETLRDPRLAGVDLSALVRRIDFRVELADGSPAAEASCFLIDRRGVGERLQGVMLENGRGAILAGPEPVDVLVQGQDESVTRVEGLQPDQCIVLPGLLQCRVVVDATLTQLAEEAELRVDVETPAWLASLPNRTIARSTHGTSSSSGFTWGQCRAVKGEGGVWTVESRSPGLHRLRWVVDTAAGEVLEVANESVQLTAGGELQHRSSLDEGALRAAIAQRTRGK
jgi:hypothetical protein